MPEGKRIGAFRSDSAAYQAAIFNYCDPKDEVIASNRKKETEETIAWYTARGEHSENRIKIPEIRRLGLSGRGFGIDQRDMTAHKPVTLDEN